MENLLTILAAYFVGITTPLTVEWYREQRRRRRIERITAAWFEHNNDLVSIDHLVRDVGIDQMDLYLLFKANLIHALEQLHPKKASGSPSGLGLTPDLINDLKGLKPSMWSRIRAKVKHGQ